jgi:hypothetical protein
MPPYSIDNRDGPYTLGTATRAGEYIQMNDLNSISLGDLVLDAVTIGQNTESVWSRFDIINCRDCKYYNQDGYECNLGWCNLDNRERTSDWYCADAERK